MGKKLRIFVFLLLSIVIHMVKLQSTFAFVISPSHIEVPLMHNNESFIVDIVSDAQLKLLATNCTIVQVSLDETNKLRLFAPPYSVSNYQQCTISVLESDKPSIFFDFSIDVNISSLLVSNITITYDDVNLVLKNIGTGLGEVWVFIENNVSRCSLNPGESCSYAPQGIVKVCSDELCTRQVFHHEFAQRFLSREYEEKIKFNRSFTDSSFFGYRNWPMITISIAILLLVTLSGYFACRNRTFFKNTR